MSIVKLVFKISYHTWKCIDIKIMTLQKHASEKLKFLNNINYSICLEAQKYKFKLDDTLR